MYIPNIDIIFMGMIWIFAIVCSIATGLTVRKNVQGEKK